MWRLRYLFFLVYIIIGLVVAWEHGYATFAWLKTVASAVLAVFLWWLVLLGVNLHVHRAGLGEPRLFSWGAYLPDPWNPSPQTA